MKIAHLCLSCFYIDGYNYQENALVKRHVDMGHEVIVVASTETYGDDGRLTYIQPNEYKGTDGANVIRLPYSKIFPHRLGKKIRSYAGVIQTLESFEPDIIMFHGLCALELTNVAKYCRNNPNVLFYIDSHEDSNNSAKNWLSRNLLHKVFYRWAVWCSFQAARKVLCVSHETMMFAEEVYGLPSKVLEFYPLGGRIISDTEYSQARSEVRANFKLGAHDVLVVQSGKMTGKKKLIDSLRAFKTVKSNNVRFLVAGVLDDSIEAEVLALMKDDDRVEFVGWQSTPDLERLLCAADIYLQPGTQSATMQMSLCARCAVLLAPYPSHEVYMDKNGAFVEDVRSISREINRLVAAPDDLQKMKSQSFSLAKKLLDYDVLAQRVLS